MLRAHGCSIYFFLSSVDHSITYSSEGCYVNQWSLLWWQKYQNEFLWSSCLQDFRSSRNWNYLSLKITSNGTVKNVPGPSMLLEVLQIFAPFSWEATYKMLCRGIVWKGQGISGQLKCGNPEYSKAYLGLWILKDHVWLSYFTTSLVCTSFQMFKWERCSIQVLYQIS